MHAARGPTAAAAMQQPAPLAGPMSVQSAWSNVCRRLEGLSRNGRLEPGKADFEALNLAVDMLDNASVAVLSELVMESKVCSCACGCAFCWFDW
jgi:hypothetical protein